MCRRESGRGSCISQEKAREVLVYSEEKDEELGLLSRF